MTERPLSGRQDIGPKAVLPVTSFMVDSLISTFEMSKNGLTGLALGIGSKAVATATFASDTTDSKGGKAASFAGSEVMQTLNLLRLAQEASPNVIIATLGATFIRKTAAAFQLGGDDNRQAELIGDWADVVGQALSLGVSVTEAVGSGGVATPLLLLNTAALALACIKAMKATRGGPAR